MFQPRSDASGKVYQFRIIRVPQSSQFYQHIFQMEQGNISYPGNQLKQVEFSIGARRYLAASIYGALEWLSANATSTERTSVRWHFEESH